MDTITSRIRWERPNTPAFLSFGRKVHNQCFPESAHQNSFSPRKTNASSSISKDLEYNSSKGNNVKKTKVTTNGFL